MDTVVGLNPAPNLSNSAPYNHIELLRKGVEYSPDCRQPYQFSLTEVTSQAHRARCQFYFHLRN